VDPLIFGNVRETFAKFIRNGETVVSVRAVTDEEAEFAAETLRQYSPIAIELVPLSTGSEFTGHHTTAAAMRGDCQRAQRYWGASLIKHNCRCRYCAEEPELLPTCLFFEFQLS
jgi:hypothetical protein